MHNFLSWSNGPVLNQRSAITVQHHHFPLLSVNVIVRGRCRCISGRYPVHQTTSQLLFFILSHTKTLIADVFCQKNQWVIAWVEWWTAENYIEFPRLYCLKKTREGIHGNKQQFSLPCRKLEKWICCEIMRAFIIQYHSCSTVLIERCSYLKFIS